MKTIKSLILLLAAILMGINLTSCKDDKDEPATSLDKISGTQDLAGVWVAEDGSNDYFLFVTATNPSTFGVNRSICYWGGTYTNMANPRIVFDKDHYYTTGGTLEIHITAYNAKSGKMTVYNTQTRQTKNFRRAKTGNMAIIKHYQSTSYKNTIISVYNADNLITPIYTANIGEITFNGQSNPFWTGGKKAVVKATTVNYYNGERKTATWTDIEPDQFYTLEL